MIDLIKKSEFWTEFSSNARLQWMVIAIAFLLFLSVTKTFFEKLDESRSEAMGIYSMVEKMVDAASRPVSEDMMLETKAKLSLLEESIPQAESSSIAEAEGFSAAKTIINTTIARPRAKLIGTETLIFSGTTYWQVRIQITGGLHELNLIPLLDFFDNSHPHVRLHSFDFQPDTKGAVSVVVDYLYKQGSD